MRAAATLRTVALALYARGSVFVRPMEAAHGVSGDMRDTCSASTRTERSALRC